MPRHMKLRIATACSLLAASLSALAAAASPVEVQDEIPSRVVKFGDLDLTKDQGAAVLYTRIKTAARAVCLAPYNSVLEQRSSSDKCRDQAIARAVGDVHAPALTTYFAQHAPAAKR
jgi:UrcA family protein